jgi:hypothetical protein
MVYVRFVNFSSDLKVVKILFVQKLEQNSWLSRSCFSEQLGYKVCKVWTSISVVLKDLKSDQVTNKVK